MNKSTIVKRWVIIVSVILVSLLLLVYVGFSLFFQNHYYFRTTIDGVSYGAANISWVEESLRKQVDAYTLTLIGREGFEESIKADEISLVVEVQEELLDILASQNAFLWPKSIFFSSTYTLQRLGVIDEEKLLYKLESMSFWNDKKMKKPANAYIGNYQEDTGQYELVEAYPGTTLQKKKTLNRIIQAVNALENEVNLDKEGCYTVPAITQDNKKLLEIWNQLNQCVSARITYVFGEQEETLDGDTIKDWITLQNTKIILDEDAVREYVRQISITYDTAYYKHAFMTAAGNEITIDTGPYGWRMNREEETKELCRLIFEGVQGIREPVYLQTGASYGKYDYGDTYVEINLTTQHLYFWENGSIIIESDFVSGDASRGMATPAGIFPLTYKERNAVLKGENYRTPVSYWMPFNGGIGMHDADWRKEFGGTVYKHNGSHGCINLPPDVAEQIYEHIEKGMPVICYYEEE